MTTLVHVSATPYPSLALVVLRIDTSGDPVDSAVVVRRVVGETDTVAVVPPAGMDADAGGITLVNGSLVVVDSSAPLDTPFEYLAAPPGDDPVVVCTPVTLASQNLWRLGDPARPYLDLALRTVRDNPTTCSSANIVILGLTDDDSAGRGDLYEVPGSRYPHAQAEYQATPAFQIRFGTETLADRQAAEALFVSGAILLLRSPATYGIDPRYVKVDEVLVARESRDLRRPWRIFTVSCRQVQAPAVGSYGWTGARFADLCSGGYATWSAMLAGGLSWASWGYGVGGGGFPAAGMTWTELAATYADWTAVTATGKTWGELAGGG